MKKAIAAALTFLVLPAYAVAEPTNVELCKGAIAVSMMKDPSIIEGQSYEGTPYVSYIRPADGSKWEFKCKFPEKGLIVWAGKDSATGNWGRWRDRRLDSRIFYSLSSDSVEFREKMGSTVMGSEAFSFEALQ